MDLKIKDKVYLVTGGAKGIGKSICKALAAEGGIPVVIGRNASDNQALVEEIERSGGTAFAIEAELTDPEAIRVTVEKAIERFGKIDGLVNNAGLNDGVGLENGDYESFVKSLHHNLIHYYLMAHYALPYLKKSKGSILNIGSKVADSGQGNTSAYAASNGGRHALTREWALELLPYEIRVNAIVVSECATPQYDKWLATLGNPGERLKAITERIPLGKRMTSPDEIADTAVFLLSARSSHTTGQLVYVDGGYVHLDRAI